jgi:hypothetical protein
VSAQYPLVHFESAHVGTPPAHPVGHECPLTAVASHLPVPVLQYGDGAAQSLSVAQLFAHAVLPTLHVYGAQGVTTAVGQPPWLQFAAAVCWFAEHVAVRHCVFG